MSQKCALVKGRGARSLLTVSLLCCFFVCLARPTHAQVTDPDRDGLVTGYEVTIGTNPFDPDTDHDGMPDGWEDAEGTNPAVADATGDLDSDGLSNLGEYLMATDPMIADTDGGGVNDGAEAAWGTDPLLALDDDSGLQSDTLGNTTGYNTGFQGVGNVYKPTADTVLIDFDQYLNPAAGTTVVFYLYQSATVNGTYTQLYSNAYKTAAGGEGFYKSGTFGVKLLANNYYFVAAGFSNASVTYYYLNGPTLPISTSFGTMETGGSMGYLPPYPTGLINATSRAFYQVVRTQRVGGLPKHVAVLRDAAIWLTAPDQLLTSVNIPFDIYNSAAIPGIDYSLYDKILVYSYQPIAFYQALVNATTPIEAWVRKGGDFLFHGFAYPSSDKWEGTYTIPTGLQGNTIALYNNFLINSPSHYSMTNVTEAGLDGEAARGYFTATGGTPTNAVVTQTGSYPILSSFAYGAGHVLAHTFAIELYANPSAPVEDFPALLRNTLLHIDRPQSTCTYTGGYAFSNSVTYSGTSRLRGNVYSVSAPAILDRFYEWLGPPAGEILYFDVYEGTSATGPWTRIFQTSVVAAGGDNWYAPAYIGTTMVPGKYYAMTVTWRNSSSYYGQTSVSPDPISSITAISGIYRNSAPFPPGSGSGLATQTTGYYQYVYLEPLSQCRAPDADGDGITSYFETNFLGSNAASPDGDSDGMPDAWEYQYGFNPANAADATGDPDWDGLTNREEYDLGTDPNWDDTDGDGYTDGVDAAPLSSGAGRYAKYVNCDSVIGNAINYDAKVTVAVKDQLGFTMTADNTTRFSLKLAGNAVWSAATDAGIIVSGAGTSQVLVEVRSGVFKGRAQDTTAEASSVTLLDTQANNLNYVCKDDGALDVAVQNRANQTGISYWYSSSNNNNRYAEVLTILDQDPESRFSAREIKDPTAAELSSYDVLVLPDNAVPDALTTGVNNWFVPGKVIVAIDHAVNYLGYSGLMWPASAGTNGYGTYWYYNGSSATSQYIEAADFITKYYNVGQIIGSVTAKSVMRRDNKGASVVPLSYRSGTTNYLYAAYRDVPGKGRVIFLGPLDPPPANTADLIRQAVAGKMDTATLRFADPRSDQDGDGLNDWLETFFGTNLFSADSDGDGISDYDEIFNYLTDPNNADTDGDGMSDGWEVLYGADPFFNDADSDPDGDGLTNLEEYRSFTDPLFPNNDNDRDGLANEVEDNTRVFLDMAHTGTSPVLSDTDAGTELDGLEAYLGRNPNSNPSDDVKWSTPARVYSNTYEEILPSLGINGAGTIFVAFERQGQTYPICYRTWSGSSWSGYTNVTSATSNAHNPLLRTAPDGVLHLFWQESGASWTLNHAYYNGSAFTGAEVLETRANQAFQSYDVQIDGQGNFHWVWVERNVNYYLYYHKQGSSISTIVSSSADAIYSSRLAIDFADFPHVIWNKDEPYPNDSLIKYATTSSSSSWTTHEVLGSGDNPVIAADAKGFIYAAWQKDGDIQGAVRDLWNWISFTNVSRSMADSLNPAFANDSQKNVNLVWCDKADQSNVVKTSMTMKGEFLDAIAVGQAQNDDDAPVSFTGIGKPDGDLFLAWQEIYTDGTDTEISYSYLDYGDQDGDGLNDRLEFLLGTDYLGIDTDGDGISDGTEVLTYASDPLETDSDRDGIDDGDELAANPYVTNPALSDSDGGGEQDGLEEFNYGNPGSSQDDRDWDDYQTILAATSSDQFGKISSPDIAAATDGNLHAVYVDKRLVSGGVFYRHSTVGAAGWDTAEWLVGAFPSIALEARVAVGTDGTVSVVYGKNTYELYLIQKTGVSWGTTTQITNCAASSFECRDTEIAVGPDNNLNIVYTRSTQSSGNIGDVWFQSYNGSVWQNVTNLSNVSTSNSNSPDIAVGPDGTIHVVWSEGSYGNQEVVYRSYNGSTWSNIVRLSTTLSDSSASTVAAGNGGQAYVAWTEVKSAYKNEINFSMSKGNNWTLPVNPLGKEGFKYSPSYLDSAYFRGGTYFITYRANEGTVSNIYTVPFNGKKWFKPLQYEQPMESPQSVNSTLLLPRMALDNNGNIHQVYVAFNQSVPQPFINDIYYRRLIYPDSDGDVISNLQEFYMGTDRNGNDTDGDGILDINEAASGTDPNLADTDGDGLGDYDELNVYHTNPALSDTDNDGMPDRWEIDWTTQVLVPDGGADLDGDGLTNFQEFVNHTDPHDSDTDNDGMDDLWEVQNGLSPITPDQNGDPDGDGLSNSLEYLYHTDPNNPDTDGDAMPDGWEVTNLLEPNTVDALQDPDFDGLLNISEYNGGIGSTNPHNWDTDGDWIPDGWERMRGLNPLVNDAGNDPDGDGLTNYQEYLYNLFPFDPDSEDNGGPSGDGMPDGWEVTYQLDPHTNDASGDPDGDGLNNLGEYTNNTFPKDSDSDDDGLSDGDEVVTYTTNPRNPDTDGDTMPDGYEVAHSCLLPKTPDANSDFDGDGLTNNQERTYGTDPCDMDQDTDNDGMPDGWEVTYALDPLLDDAADDPDFDGLSNLAEYQQGRNPRSPEAVPSSSVSIAATLTNANSVTVDFTCSDQYAVVHLWKKLNEGSWSDTGLTQSGFSGSFNYSFPGGQDGTYYFYSIAVLSLQKTELAPASPDDSIFVDRVGPVMTSAIDDGAYTSSTTTLHVLFGSTDQGQSGLNGYEYAIGTAAYPTAGWNSVVTWTADADGDVTRGGLSLLPGATYYLTGRSKDVAGTDATPLSTDGIRVDTSAPTAFTVTDDGAYTGYMDRIHASWTMAGDTTSGIDRYEYCIGSAPGLGDVVGWTNNFLLTDVTRMGLSLLENQSYFVGVRAYNGAGLYLEAWSDGILVDSKGPVIVYSSPAHREIVNDTMPPVANQSFAINFGDSGGSGIDWAAPHPIVLDFSTVVSYSLTGDTVSFVWGNTLNLGNHVVNVTVSDYAGNALNQNVIFVIEDPRKVFINPVYSEWRPGD
ncbi:MAG TPA: hypothetical protein VM658_15685, partial [bacterium]|nr:hypothetical protein [bacterium]